MSEVQTNNFLEKESLGKLMCKYSIPCIISLLVAALYNIVDQIFIANASYLGSYGNAASTVIFPLTIAALAIATLIGDGCCTFVSISLGAKEVDNAHRSVGSSVITTIGISIVLMLIYFIFSDQIVTMFGGTVNEETFNLSKEYFFWITVGIPFYMFGQAMNPIIRSDGSPQFAMLTLLLGAGINIILDPICIFVLHWGMTGAAVATILGQIVSAVVAAAYLPKMKCVKLNADSFKFRFSLMKKVLPLGITSFLSQISFVLSLAAVLNMVTKYGAMDEIFSQAQYAQIPTAIVGIVMKFFQIIMSISVGIAAGCIPVVGYNIGARRNDRVIGLMKRIMASEAIVGLIASILFVSFPQPIINIFGAANESVYYTDYAIKCIRTLLCLLMLSCINKGTFIFMQSMGNAKVSTGLSLLREIVFGVGLPVILPIFFGFYGILYFLPLADIITFIFSATALTMAYKKMKKPAEESTEAVTEKAAVSVSGQKPLADVIIAIGRSYGAGGRSVGKLLSEKFSIPYYDAALLEEAAKNSGLSQKFLNSRDEKPIDSSMLYQYAGFVSSQYKTIAAQADAAQREIIEKIADNGPCVIVGRRADKILKDRKNLLSVFVSADEEVRAKHIAQRENLSQSEALKKVKHVDKERAAYYNQHSDKKWGEAVNYDVCADTGKLGIDGAAEVIAAAVNRIK